MYFVRNKKKRREGDGKREEKPCSSLSDLTLSSTRTYESYDSILKAFDRD